MIEENYPKSCREIVELMPHVFQAEKAKRVDAVIQFNISGEEVENYYLTIKNGECKFSVGVHNNSKLTINSPAGVWVAISTDKLNAVKAFISGKFTAKGDIGLLMKMPDIFVRLREQKNETS